jgi:Positive regulator of sigma E activity
MIEEIATVQSVHDDWASVVTTQRPSCHNCHEVNSCGTSVLSKFFGAKQIELNIHSKLPLKQGDQVVVGMKETVFLGLTGLIYFFAFVRVIFICTLWTIFGEYTEC